MNKQRVSYKDAKIILEKKIKKDKNEKLKSSITLRDGDSKVRFIREDLVSSTIKKITR